MPQTKFAISPQKLDRLLPSDVRAIARSLDDDDAVTTIRDAYVSYLEKFSKPGAVDLDGVIRSALQLNKAGFWEKCPPTKFIQDFGDKFERRVVEVFCEGMAIDAPAQPVLGFAAVSAFQKQSGLDAFETAVFDALFEPDIDAPPLAEAVDVLLPLLEKVKGAEHLGEANAPYGLGEVARMQGAPAVARSHYEAALAIYREIGYRLGEANALHGLGDVARMQDDPAVARSHYKTALAIYREIGHRLGEANALYGLGDVARILND